MANLTDKPPKGSRSINHNVQLNQARMMQDYQLSNTTDASLDTASTTVQPSPQVVQNILQFARAVQTLRIGDVNIKVYLN